MQTDTWIIWRLLIRGPVIWLWFCWRTNMMADSVGIAKDPHRSCLVHKHFMATLCFCFHCLTTSIRNCLSVLSLTLSIAGHNRNYHKRYLRRTIHLESRRLNIIDYRSRYLVGFDWCPLENNTALNHAAEIENKILNLLSHPYGAFRNGVCTVLHHTALLTTIS